MNELYHIRKDLAHAIRRLYERGLVSGVGGNASVLLPSRKEILITPAGFFKGGVAEGDLVKVTLRGVVTGPGRPSSELATHLAAYRVRSDVKAVVHGHPPIAVGLVTVGIEIPPLTPEHAVMIRNLEVLDFALPGERGANAIRHLLKKCDLVGIRNHGFFSLGADLHEAASRLEVLEESARIYLSAHEAGKKISTISEENLRMIRNSYDRNASGP